MCVQRLRELAGENGRVSDEIARAVKITSVGRPYMVEEDAPEAVRCYRLTVEPTMPP